SAGAPKPEGSPKAATAARTPVRPPKSAANATARQSAPPGEKAETENVAGDSLQSASGAPPVRESEAPVPPASAPGETGEATDDKSDAVNTASERKNSGSS